MRDPTSFYQIVYYARLPALPVVAGLAIGASAFHQDHWHGMTLTGLDEGECFKDLIHGSKAAREAGHCVGVTQEHQLARKEVFETDEFGIALDDVVGVGFKWQADGKTEARFTAWSFVPGLHDSHASAGDGHPSLGSHQSTKLARCCVVRMGFGSPCTSKDGDLAHVLPAVKDSVCSAHFTQGAFHDFHLPKIRAVFQNAERSAD